jgi:hypothetical protein
MHEPNLHVVFGAGPLGLPVAGARLVFGDNLYACAKAGRVAYGERHMR